MSLNVFNQQASNFLRDLSNVFPNDMMLAKAIKLVDAAINLDERTFVPSMIFMDGQPQQNWTNFERNMFQIPSTHLQQLWNEMNDQNKDVCKRYMLKLATICSRLESQFTDLNATVGAIKQSDAFGSVTDMLNEFNQNPAAMIQQLTSNSDLNGFENIAEVLSQNPEISNIVGNLAENIDISQIASILPSLTNNNQ
jgi:hypothetical protein